MEKKDIIEFFDRCAPWWDDDMVRNEEIIATIDEKEMRWLELNE